MMTHGRGGIAAAETCADFQSVRQVKARLFSRHRRNRGAVVKEGYRLLVVDKDGVLISEFQLTQRALDRPAEFVAALQESIESVEEEEP